LREYEILKKKGKPFFPYAIMKDSVMMLIVAGVLVAMSIIMGAEQGPKADPTTTTYTPRPEWYFFYLFELLRVIKPPALVPVATIGIPTICMVLLLLLPFYDRGPQRVPWKRPIATTTGIMVIIAMALLTYKGAVAGSPSEIELATSPQYEKGKAIVAESGCLACHAIGENGAHGGLGPDLTDIGSKIPKEAIKRSVAVGPGIMPSFQGLGEENLNEVADYLASLDGEE
ncbi:MAG TPA: c-type cytochrome, partial [Solirubrobacterales bacterium]|nr:c-type cytochrome [Solirubrobacterales bacterium]